MNSDHPTPSESRGSSHFSALYLKFTQAEERGKASPSCRPRFQLPDRYLQSALPEAAPTQRIPGRTQHPSHETSSSYLAFWSNSSFSLLAAFHLSTVPGVSSFKTSCTQPTAPNLDEARVTSLINTFHIDSPGLSVTSHPPCQPVFHCQVTSCQSRSTPSSQLVQN